LIQDVNVGEIGQAAWVDHERIAIKYGPLDEGERVRPKIGMLESWRRAAAGLPAEQHGMKLSFANIKGSPYESFAPLVSPRSDNAVLD
jgi:hypothetical protein